MDVIVASPVVLPPSAITAGSVHNDITTSVGNSASSNDVVGTPLSIVNVDLPVCDENLKPVVGMAFECIESAFDFYKAYGVACGFDVKKHCQKKLKDGTVYKKRFSCANQGQPVFSNQDCSPSSPKVRKRSRVSKRVGCDAHIVLFLHGGRYVVRSFVEGHSHLLSTPSCGKFLHGKRELNPLQKKFISDCMRVNIGPVKAYRIFKELCGSHDNVGASLIDFKNFGRDMKSVVGTSDAQMVIDNFIRKKEVWESFFFDFSVDEDENLTRLFWADPVSIEIYASFGDCISFDATYHTNKYDMVFAPFIGVDHHKRCITFAVGLILKEDVESFVWLFECFLKAFKSAPVHIITDQDPAMKVAVGQVFPSTHHRFCMWYIMEKLSSKVGAITLKRPGFHAAITACVWDIHSDITTFEDRWHKFITEFKMEDNEWLSSLYDMRRAWIPAYFNDVFMGGLLRTNSGSESENNFFSQFIGRKSSLVEFMLRFDTALDAQRHKGAECNHLSYSTLPEMKTPLVLERKAADVYTRELFLEFQCELMAACFRCSIEDVSKEDDNEVYMVRDVDRGRNFQVSFDSVVKRGKCACKNFEMFGIPCRHLLLLLKGEESFPDFLVAGRWSKFASKLRLYPSSSEVVRDSAGLLASKRMLNDAWFQFNTCLSIAERNSDVQGLIDHLNSYKMASESHRPRTRSSRVAEIEGLLGSKVPSVVNVHPPAKSNHKGGRRPIGEKEAMISRRKKISRMCKTCNELCYHDSCTCPHKVK